MYFRQILHEERACASYLVGCPSEDVCAVIDPQGDPQRYIEQAAGKGLVIDAVIETHIQADHRSCAAELADLASVPLYFGPGAEVAFAHESLPDGYVLPVGNRRLRAIHAPGHTPEHICLLVDDWFILSGDTLFVGDVGRVDLSMAEQREGDLRARASQLYESVQRLLALPDWVEIYPGHYAGSVCGHGMDGKPVSTIGWERRNNPALRLSADAFVDYLTGDPPPLPPDFRAIKRANSGKE